MTIFRNVAVFFLVLLIFFASMPCDARAKKAIPQAKVEKLDTQQISQSVVDALSSGDLNGAIIALREEKTTPKLLYLVREVTRAASAETQKKPEKTDAHRVYQNFAISYHNIYLFLKARGIEQDKYFEEAVKYYKKARGAGTKLHKTDCDILSAALLASHGDDEKAKKQFSKINLELTRGDFESTEYLAAYYAAIGDVDGATLALEKAYSLNPGALLTWLAVGDDFYKITADPAFQGLLVSWKVKDAEKKLTLSVPKGDKPRLQVADDTGLFRPQKSMPHYNLKKKAAVSKKATTVAKKSAKKKKGQASKIKPASKTKK